MAQKIQLPDGTLFPMREGETPEQALMVAASLYPDAFAPKPAAPAPQSGGIAALKAGVSGLKGDIAALLGRTGAIDPGAAERYIEEQKQYQARTFKPTEEGWTQAPLTKFSELLGGSAAYMAAPLAAGVAAAALPVAAPTATVLGLGAAGAASFGQFTGSFLSRQMETGKKLGETNLGSATLAALPATALDTISLRMIPGIRNLLGAAGRQVTEAQAKEIAQQNLGRAFGDYVATTGKVAGVEGLTESAQQVLERLQAGLSITDREARDEYIESFLGGAILGGTLSVPGRFYERGKIKDVAADAEARDRQAARQALAQQQEAAKLEEEAKRKTPEYLDDLEQRYAQLKTRERELVEATKGPVDKSDPLSVETRRRAQSELGTFKTSKEYKSLVEEYRQAYDDLLPRMQERKTAAQEQQRVDRVQAAPQGTQLNLAGEPGAVQDMSLQGQIKSLNQYIGSLNGQIKTAQKANDTQQVKLLQQKQEEARQQIVALFPDQSLLEEARVRAEQSLVPYQQQIETLTQMPELTAEQKQQLDEISAAAKPFRDAAAEIRNIQAQIAKYAPAETTAQVNKPVELKKLYAQLENLGATGEDVAPTLAKIRALESQVVEQPALFGEEDLIDVTPRGLGDFIADERERVKALREKLDSERAALQRMAAAPQTERSEEIRIRRQTLDENVRNTAKEIQQRNQDLNTLEKKQTLLDKLLKDKRTPLVAQGISTLQTQIADLQKKLRPTAPKVAQPRTKLLAAEQEGEFAPRVTDAQLMEQRDRDIAALLDQFLPGALGVTPTQETLQVQGPEGPREVRLTTLGGETNAALRKQLGDIQARRNNATEELFEVGGPAADALRSEIVMLSVTEAELRRKIDKLEPLSAEYRQDLQSLVRQAFTRAPAIPRSRTPNLAEQQYLDAVEELEAIQDETQDTVYAMNKLAYKARIKGIPGTTTRSWHYAFGEGPEVTKPGSVAELIQNNPVIQAGMQAQARVSAAQRRVDELAKRMPELPDLTNTDLDTKIDALVDEFSEGTPKELAALRSKARRVPAAVRPPALRGADIPAQIAANDRQIEQLNQDIQYAGKPSGAEKVAALNQMKAERDRRRAENKRLTEQYNKLQAAEPAEETGEVAEMRQELATIERTLAAGTFKDNANVTRQLETARDELKGRIEAAVGPQRPEPEEAEGQREFLPAAGFPSTALAGRLKPVPAEDLTKARTAIVAATQKIEDIRKAAMRVADMGPKYFQEVATTYQQRIKKDAADRARTANRINVLEKRIEYAVAAVKNLPADQQDTAVVALEREGLPTLDFNLVELRQQLAETKTELATLDRRADAMKDATAEVQRFLNLARLAGVNKTTNLRESLDQALDVALADKEKKEAALADLERKQRMYEQQEAARRGVDLGEAEAEKLVAGETAGYVSGRGKALADKRKDKRSWVISKDSKVKVIKPDQSKKLQEALQNAAGLVGRAALQNKLIRLQKELVNLQQRETGVLRRVKDPNKAPEYAYTDFVAAQTKVIKEIEALKAQLNIPQIKEARLETEKAAEALKGAPTPEQIAPLKEALSKLQAQLNAYYTPEKAAELQAEMDRLREALSAVPVPPVIANIASAYSKATTTTKGLPAPERVAQMMFETGVKEQKAANNLKTAEAAVTAAQLKANAATQALQQNQDKLAKAEKKLERLKDPAKIGAVKREISGIKLQLGNLQGTTQKRADAILDAQMALRTAEADYMAARLERLTLNQQMGEHAKREAASITAQLATAAETVVGLQKQLDTAAANEAAMRQKLDKSSAALEKAEADAEAARQAARNAERLAKEKAQTAALDAAKTAQDKARAIQTGLGLPGRRIERDTAGTLMTAAQADIRQRMATAETNLSKAIKAGNQADIRKYTAEVNATTRELAQVYGKAPVRVTEVGIEREAAEQPAAVEGMRLPSRREGPSVRYVRGGSKAIMQSGAIKLRAAGLSQEAANAISLYVAKNKIKGAKKDETRATLTKQFDALTKGMTPQQVDAALAEGKRLMGLGPTAELIAKRSAYQEALENFQTLDRAKNEAKTPLQKELARDALEVADAQRQRASDAYDQAKALYETSQIRAAKKAEKNAVEALFEEADVELPKARRAKKKDTTAAAVEAFDEESGFEETPITEAADEEQRDIASVKYRTIKQTGKGLQVQAVTNLVKRITSEWALVPDIEIVETESGLPVRILKQAQADKMSGRIPGLYDPKSGKVFLVAANLHTPNDVVLTVSHEVAGHFGLRSMLGAQYNAEMDRIYNGNRDVKAKADAKMREMPALDQRDATEEVLAEMAELDPNANAPGVLRSIYNAIKSWVKKFFGQTVSDKEVQQIVANARRQVIYGGVDRAAEVASSRQKYSSAKPQYESENALTELADKIIAQPESFVERNKSNLALKAEMNAVDMRAAVQEVLKRGAKDMGKDDLFTQAMYNVRKADQYMPLVYTALTNGPLEYYTDEKGLRGIKSSNDNNAEDIFTAINAVPGRNTEAKIALASTYMIAQRAANKGLSKLDIGALGLQESELSAAMAAANADPALKSALEEVRRRYNAYNEGQIKFLADSGKITKAQAKEWLKDGDYVPYYRVREDGTAELVFGGEKTLTIGDIRTQPYLAELKGGDTKILPLNESIIRNTMLITKAALYNNATKEIAYAMQEFGDGKGKDGKNAMPIHKGHGPTGTDIIRFDQEPDPKDPDDDGKRWLRIKTENTVMEGIPSELVVKSLEGAHLTLPAFLKVGGIAGDWLRKGVTRMPPYIFRQLIRDPMAASFTGGLNYGPFRAVVMAGTEFLRTSVGQTQASKNLIEKGLIQSNLFTGDPDDMSTFATQLASGKDGPAIDRFLGVLDRAAIRADAATRSLVYDSARKNGLSEVEADMMTMESMNFYKRGLSPTVQYANRLIPFMNAQIQGLNVLVKAMRGNMPFEERQKIQRKFINNAFLLFGVGLVYAFAMDDDEAFKNAKPRDKYSNFFVNLAGLDEPLKIPLPYESGWFFSAAVALVDAMKAETDNKQQLKALRDMFLSSVPGYSSLFMPQAIKPLLEVYTNKNFFSGQNIESPSMQNRDPEARFTASTTEAAKALAKVLPLSPVQIEHLARGYFGTAPIAVMAAASSLMRGEEKGEAPERKLTETPIIGSTFQRKYGGADADSAYAFAKEATQRAATLRDMQKTSTLEEQKEYLAEHRAEIKLAPMARNFETLMGRVRTQEALVRKRTDLNAEEKRKRLDELDRVKQDLADKFNAAIRKAGGS
jgi:chromosome segregation ATPase